VAILGIGYHGLVGYLQEELRFYIHRGLQRLSGVHRPCIEDTNPCALGLNGL